MDTTTTLARDIRAALAALASAKTRADFERYFKGAVRFHGVKRPAVTAFERAVRPRVAALAPDARVTLALALLRAERMEERQVGLGVLAREVKRLPDDFVDTLAALFDDVVQDWATCDMLCGKVLRAFVVRSPAARARVAAWSRARNIWRQRASAVAFVNEARTGAHDDVILSICGRIVRNDERFVQLGCGWVLRELWRATPERTVAFLESHLAELSREGLRYAIEKMPKREQQRLLALHSARAMRQTTPRRRS